MLVGAVTVSARALDLVGRRVLVAVSGGVDSTVLLHALASAARELRLSLAAGHVNHGLRGPDADADQEAVRVAAEALGVAFVAERVDPSALRQGRPSRARPTLQEAARRVRYDALGRLAGRAGAERIATAHTADDQAETVLLRLLRGCGPDGLGGIPERSPDGVVVRPLLGVTRSQVLAYARSQGLSWREDSSNARPEFARSRLRRLWLPGLRDAFNPRLLRALGDLAEAHRRDAEWTSVLVAEEAERRFRAEGDALLIERDDWSALPEALARRLARLALHRCGRGRDVSRVHLGRMLAFLRSGRPGRCLQLPGGLELTAGPGAFRLQARGVAGSCPVLESSFRKGETRRAAAEAPRGNGPRQDLAPDREPS
jgi:tRNA(Ile)-lysidine synthase